MFLLSTVRRYNCSLTFGVGGMGPECRGGDQLEIYTHMYMHLRGDDIYTYVLMIYLHYKYIIHKVWISLSTPKSITRDCCSQFWGHVCAAERSYKYTVAFAASDSTCLLPCRSMQFRNFNILYIYIYIYIYIQVLSESKYYCCI